jgi:Zn-dependent protease with chaperone function
VGVIAPPDRETFDRAQRRHRRSARLRAIPAALAAAVMGIPIGVYLSPVLLALAIVVTDLVNLVIPTADLGGAVWSLLDGLIDGNPAMIQAIAWILLIWLIPGIILLAVLSVVIAWRLRRIGGEGIALAMGGRAPRTDDAEEVQLIDIATELAVAAGIEPPRVLVYDDGPANALVFGPDHDHATVLLGRRLLDELDREQTQGVVARLVASAVDGDLGLAVDIGAVYVAFGLVTTTLAAAVSHAARARWRAAVSPLVGRRHEPVRDAVAVAALLGPAPDDDQPTSTAGGCLTLLTMGGLIGIGVSLINLFLAGPLLTFAWRSRGYLADATAVELTRDPDGLARALKTLGGSGRDLPGTAWLELLLVVGASGGGGPRAGTIPRLSDTGLVGSLVPSVARRLGRLQAMGADAVGPVATAAARATSPAPHRRLATLLLVLIIAPLVALIGILLVIATALLVYLVALAAFVVLAIVAGPLHEVLRGIAGR